MTVATLGLVVDSNQVSHATPELQQLTAAAGQAEAAADRLRLSTSSGASAQSAATAAVKVHTAALQAQAAAQRMVANTQRQLAFQLNDVAVSLASGMNPLMVAVQQGSQIAQLGLKEVAGAALGMARSFAPILIAVGAVMAAVAGLTASINKTSDVTVTFGDTALATWQVVSAGLYGAMKPALDWLLGTLGGLWNWIAPGLQAAANGIIGAFVGAFEAVKATWSILPAALGDIVMSTTNAVITGLEGMINDAIRLINDFTRGAREGLSGLGIEIGEIGEVKFGGVDNPWAGKAGEAAGAAASAFEGAQGDYVGDAIGAIGTQAKKNARARELEEIGESATKAADGLNVFDVMLRDVDHLLREASDPFTELRSNLDPLGALLAAGEISWQQYGEAVARANMQAASGTLSAVSQITGVLAGAFEDNKAIAAANIVVSTAAGAMKALETMGPFGFPMAAAITAAGVAQLSSVLSAKPGSASIAGATGSASTSGSASAQPAARSISINLQGDNYSRESVGSLVERLNAELGIDGLQLSVTYKQA